MTELLSEDLAAALEGEGTSWSSVVVYDVETGPGDLPGAVYLPEVDELPVEGVGCERTE